MKKFRFLIVGICAILFALATKAQTATGFEYFKGKWNVTAEGPQGAVKMVIEFDQKDGNAVSTICGIDEKELYKVVSTEVKDNTAIVTFIGSQGSEVPFELTKKDETHLTGSIMNMFDAAGERAK